MDAETTSFFSSIDQFGRILQECDKIEPSCLSSDRIWTDHPVSALLDAFVKAEDIDLYSNANLIGSDGSFTSIPTIYLSSFDKLTSAIKDVACKDVADVAISLPGPKWALESLKELLVNGETSPLSLTESKEVRALVLDIGLGWNMNISAHPFSRDDLNFESGDEYECSSVREEFSSDIEEENTINEYWGTSISVQDPHISRAKVCSKSCLFDCYKVWNTWIQEDKDAILSIFTGKTKLKTKNKLISHLAAQGHLGIETDCYVVKSQKFCIQSLSHISGISEYLLKLVMKDYWRGIRLYDHGNKEIFKQPSVATISFIGWLRQFLEHYGQNSPDEELIILPYWLKGKALYNIYVKEVAKPRVALRTFYNHLDTYFGPQRIDKSLPRMRISQYSSHSVCDTCAALQIKRQECISEAELNLVRGLINQHQLEFSSARQAVEGIKNRALDFAEDNLFIQLGRLLKYP